MSELRLDVGTANELKLGMHSARATDGSEWTDADVKSLTGSDFLGKVLSVLRGQAEIVMKKVEETIVALLILVKVVTVETVAGKKTKNCFTNKSRYYYRDSDLDAWLPENQPAESEGKFLVRKLDHPATFKQVVENFLRETGDVQTLSRSLKRLGHVTTLSRIEFLIERQEAGEDIGLLTNGRANFFFVEDKDGSVSVVYASRHDRRGYVYVYRLDYDFVWFAYCRFFFRN